MDKLIKEALLKEEKRQNDNIELIASENYVSKDILELQGEYITLCGRIQQVTACIEQCSKKEREKA